MARTAYLSLLGVAILVLAYFGWRQVGGPRERDPVPLGLNDPGGEPVRPVHENATRAPIPSSPMQYDTLENLGKLAIGIYSLRPAEMKSLLESLSESERLLLQINGGNDSNFMLVAYLVASEADPNLQWIMSGYTYNRTLALADFNQQRSGYSSKGDFDRDLKQSIDRGVERLTAHVNNHAAPEVKASLIVRQRELFDAAGTSMDTIVDNLLPVAPMPPDTDVHGVPLDIYGNPE